MYLFCIYCWCISVLYCLLWYPYPMHCFYKLDEFYCINGWYVFHVALKFLLWLYLVVFSDCCVYFILYESDLFQWFVKTSVLILTHSISNGLWTSFSTCNWIYLNIINIDIDINVPDRYRRRLFYFSLKKAPFLRFVNKKCVRKLWQI
jgi:hypothetical protein